MTNEFTNASDAKPVPANPPAPSTATASSGVAFSPPPRPRVAAKPDAPEAPAKKSGLAKAAMTAAGVAAGVAATFGGIEAVDALSADDDEPLIDGVLEDTVFDETLPDVDGGWPAAEPVSSGGGGGGGGGGGAGRAARPSDAPRSNEADSTSAAQSREPAAGGDQMDNRIVRSAPPDLPGETPDDIIADGEFEAARQRVLTALDGWEPPEGADPEQAAALRAQLAGTIERFVPAAGQSVDDAVATLRDEVDQRVKNFAQDQRIEAIVEELAEKSEADVTEDELPDEFGETWAPVTPEADAEASEDEGTEENAEDTPADISTGDEEEAPHDAPSADAEQTPTDTPSGDFVWDDNLEDFPMVSDDTADNATIYPDIPDEDYVNSPAGTDATGDAEMPDPVTVDEAGNEDQLFIEPWLAAGEPTDGFASDADEWGPEDSFVYRIGTDDSGSGTEANGLDVEPVVG